MGLDKVFPLQGIELTRNESVLSPFGWERVATRRLNTEGEGCFWCESGAGEGGLLFFGVAFYG